MNKLYEMKLHETIEVATNDGKVAGESGPTINYWITRVPGGWLYQGWNWNGTSMTTTFVPFSDEFKLGI